MTTSIPDGRSIANADALATTLNSNNYMRQTIDIMVTKNHLEEEFKEVNGALDQNSRIVQVRYGYMENLSAKCYMGMATDQDLENTRLGVVNFIDASVLENLNKLKQQNQKISDVIMPFYIDDTSQLMRGYVIDGEATGVDEDAEQDSEAINKNKLVDDICQSWFVSQGLGSDENGRIHRRAKDGTLSAEVIAPDELRRRMEDPETGLAAKAKQLAPNTNFSLYWKPPTWQPETAEAPRQ